MSAPIPFFDCPHLHGYWINERAGMFRCFDCGHQQHLPSIQRDLRRRIEPAEIALRAVVERAMEDSVTILSIDVESRSSTSNSQPSWRAICRCSDGSTRIRDQIMQWNKPDLEQIQEDFARWPSLFKRQILCRICQDEISETEARDHNYRCSGCAKAEDRHDSKAAYYASLAAPGDDFSDVDHDG